VASLDLADVEVESWEEVVDPAAGDQAVFDACAAEIRLLVEALTGRLPTPA
jgi:protein-tyrosine-phosphatase